MRRGNFDGSSERQRRVRTKEARILLQRLLLAFAAIFTQAPSTQSRDVLDLAPSKPNCIIFFSTMTNQLMFDFHDYNKHFLDYDTHFKIIHEISSLQFYRENVEKYFLKISG